MSGRGNLKLISEDGCGIETVLKPYRNRCVTVPQPLPQPLTQPFSQIEALQAAFVKGVAMFVSPAEKSLSWGFLAIF